MSDFNLEISGGLKRTKEGNDSFYYGGGGVAWSSLEAAKSGVPVAVRSGRTIGVIEGGQVVEYMWHPSDTSDNGITKKIVLSFEVDTFFVDNVNGSDETGAIGIYSLPYETIDAVLEDIPENQEGTGRAFTIKIMNSGTYAINSVFPQKNNYIIKSDFYCTISFENNTNTSLYNNAVNHTFFQILMPNGIVKFSPTVFQTFGRTKELKIHLRELHSKFNTSTASGTHNQYLFGDTIGKSEITINKLYLGGGFMYRRTKATFTLPDTINIDHVVLNGSTGAGFRRVVLHDANNGTYSNTYIKKVTGSGDFVICSTNQIVTIGDIDIAGNLQMVDSSGDSKITFLDSVINVTDGGYFKVSGWGLRNFTLTGRIAEASTPPTGFLNGMGGSEDYYINIYNFTGSFGVTRFYKQTKVTIKDSVLTFADVPFDFYNTSSHNSMDIDFYGSNTILSLNPTQMGKGSVNDPSKHFIFNDYGTLKTNIRSIGEFNTYNKLAFFDSYLQNFQDNAAAIAAGLAVGDEYYNYTNDEVTTVS